MSFFKTEDEVRDEAKYLLGFNEKQEDVIQGTGQLTTEPSRDCRRPKTLRQYPYEKQTIPNRS